MKEEIDWKKDLLESIGFIWDPYETDWQNMFSELKEFKREQGHASPSRVNKEIALLANWCYRQFTAHHTPHNK